MMTSKDQEIVRNIIKEELASLILSDRYTFQKNLQIFDARNIQLGQENGTKIGTEDTQKLGFYGVTPIARRINIPYASGGAVQDTTARAQQNLIIDTLQAIGIIK